jgi:glutamate/tyrosine decarboxylase-like PLP-dependent enzyme
MTKNDTVGLFAYKAVDKKIIKNRVLGRAWSKQSPISVKVYSKIGNLNYNNILLHLKNYHKNDSLEITNSGTFNFSRFAEKKVLIEIAEFLKLNFSSLSGYITAGGTESNIYAMWIARNWAKKIAKEKQTKINWIIPKVSHYSFPKALDLLGILDNAKNIIHSIDKDENKISKIAEIKETIEKILVNNPKQPIVIVLTAMTTEFGLLDPIKETLAFIKEKNIQNVYVHVDACYSGFILPFTNKYKNIFADSLISSLSIDFHKTFGGPIGSGAIFVNHNLYENAEIYSSYISGNSDYTLLGSRSGLSAIQIYELWKSKKVTLKKEIEKANELTSYFFNEIKTIKEIKVLYKPFSNYLIFSTNIQNSPNYEKFVNLCNQYSVSFAIDDKKHFYKIIINHYVTKKTLSTFVKEIKQCMKEITTK